jgi:hypothetical protein
MLAALRRRIYEGLTNGNPEARKGLLRTLAAEIVVESRKQAQAALQGPGSDQRHWLPSRFASQIMAAEQGSDPVVRPCRRADIPVVLGVWPAAEVVPTVSGGHRPDIPTRCRGRGKFQREPKALVQGGGRP